MARLRQRAWDWDRVEMTCHGWENFQFPGWKHFKTVMSTSTNRIYWAGGDGHINLNITTCQPGYWDRGMRVDFRKVGQTP